MKETEILKKYWRFNNYCIERLYPFDFKNSNCMHVTMATVKDIENEICILVRDKSGTVEFHNTENGKLKGHIP